ncbi:MOSC N-terminal beta barrel domain-containing protein [Streptomyces sp. HUAS TT7]|uniref:MOSC N-terminal beta barrel domain-containing protein n=1 Tax=Streptomyces sp. HUAS TT7 TaxID=3447507 RepID=UPI003F65551E
MGEALLTSAGLAHDRSFMVVSEGGAYRTHRRHPRLAPAAPPGGVVGTGLGHRRGHRRWDRRRAGAGRRTE